MKKYFYALSFLFPIAIGNAQMLDLETCLKMADTANLTIRNARLNNQINDNDRSAYLAARLPKLSIAGDYKYNAILPGQLIPASAFGGPPGQFITAQFGVPFNLSTSAQLTQVIYNPQVNYGLAALKINTEIVKIQEGMTTQDIKYQVASTFFNLQAINKQLNFIDENLLNMDKLIQQTELLVNSGLRIQTEADKLKINRLTLVNTKETLTATKKQLESFLKILIGKPVDQTLSVQEDAIGENTILVDPNNINHPELELLAMQQKMNAEERKGTTMSYLPNLTAYGVYNYTYNIQPETDNAAAFRTGINSAAIGLKLDWVLFDGMEKYNKNKSNKLKALQLENDLETTKLQLEMRTENLKMQISVQQNSLEIAKEQITLAQNVYNQTKSQFEQGTATTSELIVNENSLQQAQTNLVSAYINLRLAELEYLKSIGNIK
ncbi:MAG: TolC family protein [Bacteroidota bacterium]